MAFASTLITLTGVAGGHAHILGWVYVGVSSCNSKVARYRKFQGCMLRQLDVAEDFESFPSTMHPTNIS